MPVGGPVGTEAGRGTYVSRKVQGLLGSVTTAAAVFILSGCGAGSGGNPNPNYTGMPEPVKSNTVFATSSTPASTGAAAPSSSVATMSPLEATIQRLQADASVIRNAGSRPEDASACPDAVTDYIQEVKLLTDDQLVKNNLSTNRDPGSCPKKH